MSFIKFSIGLLLVIGGSLLITMAFNRNPDYEPHLKFYILSISFFTLLSVLYYIIAILTVHSKNLYLFTRYSMFISLFKIIAAGGIIIFYQRKFLPSNIYYVIPFFCFYLLFTAFELISISRLNSGKV